MKIQVTMIIKNGADTIEQVINSYTGHVDRFVILDTLSSDNTLNLLKRYANVVVYQRPFRGFSNSRNECLDLAYDPKYDFTIMIDDSYELKRGSNFLALKNAPSNANTFNVTITNENGITYESARIIRTTSRVRYIGEIHEHLNDPNTYTLQGLVINDIQTDLQKVRTQERNYNDLQVLKDLKDPRSLYYKACTMQNLGYSPEEVINAFKERLDIEVFPEERFLSSIMIANIYHKQGSNECIRYYIKSALIHEGRRGESYLYLYLITNNKFWLQKAYDNNTIKNSYLPYDRNLYGSDGSISKLFFQEHRSTIS